MKKNVLITGATGNLGKATIERFIADGFRILAIVSPGKSLPPESGESFEADLTNELQVNTVVEQIIAKHQTIDAALLLVGGYAPGGLKTTEGKSLRNMFALNFETAYYVVRPVFQHMQNQTGGGRIVLIGARPALLPSDGKKMLAYALSKSLIFKLAEFLNAEGAAQNVLTTVIVPSTIDTPTNRQAMPNANFSSWVKPEEIASIMAFITSEQARAIRDGVVKVYGGS